MIFRIATGRIPSALPTWSRGSCNRCHTRRHHCHSQKSPCIATSPFFTISGIMGAGFFMITSSASPRCSMEAVSSSSRPKRRRPPIFGASVPTITSRGLVTSSDTTVPDIDDREDCPFCKKFSRGPCGEIFKQWLACTDKHPGKDASGEPLHLSKCIDLAEDLGKCLSENEEFYSKDNEEDDQEQGSATGKKGELKDAWRTFVNEMENGIISGKYNVIQFPEDIHPTMEVSLASQSGAAFFVPEKDGQPIMAAYILDDNGNVIAAGSRDDMDMGSLGCVLQFKCSDGMKSATGRVIYDTEQNSIDIYSRTMMMPHGK